MEEILLRIIGFFASRSTLALFISYGIYSRRLRPMIILRHAARFRYFEFTLTLSEERTPRRHFGLFMPTLPVLRVTPAAYLLYAS